jgi:hypothetical protein
MGRHVTIGPLFVKKVAQMTLVWHPYELELQLRGMQRAPALAWLPTN